MWPTAIVLSLVLSVGDSDIKTKILWAMKENNNLIMNKNQSCLN